MVFVQQIDVLLYFYGYVALLSDRAGERSVKTEVIYWD